MIAHRRSLFFSFLFPTMLCQGCKVSNHGQSLLKCLTVAPTTHSVQICALHTCGAHTSVSLKNSGSVAYRCMLPSTLLANEDVDASGAAHLGCQP